MWRDTSDLPATWTGCVVTVGVFDGLHRGHRALVDRARAVAAGLGLPSVLVTFDPHPLEVIRPDQAPRLLTTVRERAHAALEAGMDGVFVQQFDTEFARVEARAWVEDFLVRALGVRAVVVGEDFRFGAGNRGDAQTLQALGERHGFATELVPLVQARGGRCSSTRVRALRDEGRFVEAEDLLGHALRP